MICWTRSCWVVLGISAVATGTQLVTTADALAHEGHPHRVEPEAASTPTDQQPAHNDGAASKPSVTQNTESASETINTLQTEETSEAFSSIEAVSQAGVVEGLSIGWGESLLGLIIAGPFLLLSLKKQLQS